MKKKKKTVHNSKKPVLWDYALHAVQADSTRTEFTAQWWLEDTSERLSIKMN